MWFALLSFLSGAIIGNQVRILSSPATVLTITSSSKPENLPHFMFIATPQRMGKYGLVWLMAIILICGVDFAYKLGFFIARSVKDENFYIGWL